MVLVLSGFVLAVFFFANGFDSAYLNFGRNYNYPNKSHRRLVLKAGICSSALATLSKGRNSDPFPILAAHSWRIQQCTAIVSVLYLMACG